MNTNPFESMHRLSDDELLARVKQLVRREGEATANLVAHLAELDARRLYLSEGCSSLFVNCTQILHLSEHAAFNRIEAARAARKFPVILALLASGALHLAAVRLLAPHLTAENHAELLQTARHRSKRDLEILVARVLLLGLACLPVSAWAVSDAPPKTLSVPDAVAEVLPSVVSVMAHGPARGTPTPAVPSGSGSGVVISPGYILTSNHLVAGATRLVIGLYDGRLVPGRVVGRDFLTDLAIIKVEIEGLIPARLGSSSTTRMFFPFMDRIIVARGMRATDHRPDFPTRPLDPLQGD